MGKQKGFTIVELLVAITIFSMVMAIASNLFIRSLRAQRSVVSLIAVNDNVSLALERMARNIRTSSGFSAQNNQLSFTSARGESIKYYLSNNALVEEISGNDLALTGDNVEVKSLRFQHGGADGSAVDRITVSLSIGLSDDTQDISGAETVIQTTISARPL
ncbi:MAG: type II secretion system protein [Candidatus Harrisonbacteria bacterium]|nr:type II secretion system protein [Candidatus Harrisonbacteria bacterium]